MGTKEAMQRELVAARAISEKAAGRDLTQAEVDAIGNHLAEYERLKSEPARGFRNSDSVKSALAALGVDTGSAASPPPIDGYSALLDDDGVSVAGRGFKAKAAGEWAVKAAERIQKTVEMVGGIKSIVGTMTPVPDIITGAVNLPAERSTILGLIPTRNASGENMSGPGGNVFGFALQTVRTNNADAVLQGGLKPESDFQWQSKIDRFRKIAHRSQPQPDEILEDYPSLLTFLREEMGNGVLDELESQILTGTGTIGATPDGTPTVAEERLPGILNTSGILVQAWDTDLLTTLSAASDKLELAREKPNAWVLHPLDYRRLKNMRESGSIGPLMFKSGRSSIEQILGDIPVITSTLIPQGTGLVGDFRQTILVTRQDVAITASNGDSTLFDYNLTKFIAEGRWGFAVLRPSAFCTVDLTA